MTKTEFDLSYNNFQRCQIPHGRWWTGLAAAPLCPNACEVNLNYDSIAEYKLN